MCGLTAWATEKGLTVFFLLFLPWQNWWWQSLMSVPHLPTFSNPPPIKPKHPKAWDTDIPAGESVSRQHQSQHRAGAAQREEANSCEPPWGGRMTPAWATGHTKGCPFWPPNSYLPKPPLLWHVLARQPHLGRKESLDKVWTWVAWLSSSPHGSTNFLLLQSPQAAPEGCPALTEASGGTLNHPPLCSQQDHCHCIRGCQEVPPYIQEYEATI